MKRSPSLIVRSIFCLTLALFSAQAFAQAVSNPTPTPIDPDFDNGDWTLDIFEPKSDPNKRDLKTSICPPGDVTCQKIETALKNFSAADTQISGGVRYGSGAADVALRMSLNLISVARPQGDLRVLPFDMVYMPDAGGFRIRIGLVQGDALFFCKDSVGNRIAPLMSIFENCVDGDEHWGYGGAILQYQHDHVGDEGRTAWRWLAAQLTYAVLGNGSDVSYLQTRLNAFIGASLDTIASGPDTGTFARANIGISGLIRTNDLKWEANALVGYRPNVTRWDDYGVEARVQILHNFILKDASSDVSMFMPGSIGIEARYDGWTHPGRSFGVTASTTEADSWYIGLIFKFAIQ